MQNFGEMRVVRAYVDGSIIQDVPSFAFCIVDQNECIYENGGVLSGDVIKLRNIASELKAVIEAVEFCKKNNYKCLIIHDLRGSYEWVKEIFEPNEKSWRRNNKYTQGYYEYIKRNKQWIEKFEWQRGHQTGDSVNERFNNYVDTLSRKYHPLWKEK